MEFKRLPKRPSKMKKLFSKIIKKIKGIDDSIKLYFAILLVCLIIVARWFVVAPIEEGFGNNIRVEFFGFLFDLLIFGFGFSIFNQWNQRRQDIKRWQEEIDDYRGWKGKEYRRRITGNIKRLNQAGVTKIDLSDCHLNGADLSGLNLEGAVLVDTKLKKADLHNTNLQGARFLGTDLRGAWLLGTRLKGARIQGADLENAKVSGFGWLHELENMDISGSEVIREVYEQVYEDGFDVLKRKNRDEIRRSF